MRSATEMVRRRRGLGSRSFIRIVWPGDRSTCVGWQIVWCSGRAQGSIICSEPPLLIISTIDVDNEPYTERPVTPVSRSRPITSGVDVSARTNRASSSHAPIDSLNVPMHGERSEPTHAHLILLCRVLYQGVTSRPGVYARHERDVALRQLMKFALPRVFRQRRSRCPFHRHRGWRPCGGSHGWHQST